MQKLSRYNMKKGVALLLIALLTIPSAFAEYSTALTTRAWQQAKKNYNKPVNYVGLGLKGGYNQFPLSNSDIKAPGGAHVGLDLKYKMEYNLFRMTVGLDASFTTNTLRGSILKEAELLQPDLCRYQLNFSNIKEKQQVFELGLPIMLGADYMGFYAMAGIRLGLPLMSKYSLTTDFTRTIFDEKGIDPYTDMLNHSLYDDQKANSGKLNLKMLNPQIAVEVGYNLDPWLASKEPVPQPVDQVGNVKPKVNVPFTQLLHYEVALYANIGFSEYRSNVPTTGNFYTQQGVDITDVKSVTTDYELAGKRNIDGKDIASTMIPWNIGVKFNVYYELYDTPVNKKKKAKKKKKKKPQVVQEVVVDEPEPEIPQDTIVYNGDTLQVGDTIVMDNLYFDTDKTNIKKNSDEALNELAELLLRHPNVKITLFGHTDNVGTEEYNLRLSQGRVNSVKDELIKRGIDGERITCIGKGESEPIADNNTAEGRAENRRVEVVFDEIIVENIENIIIPPTTTP